MVYNVECLFKKLNMQAPLYLILNYSLPVLPGAMGVIDAKPRRQILNRTVFRD